MPTLLEALEEKYGFAQTSDMEAEPELLMLRLPKRTPRQRWLSIVIYLFICDAYFGTRWYKKKSFVNDESKKFVKLN